MKKWLRRLGPMLVGMLILAAIVYGFMPRPVEVDLAEVGRGPMRVTVDEEGKTRIRERYVVSAPLAGSLRRVQLKAGAPVVAGETVLAVIEPTDPKFLDARERAEAAARVKGAADSVQQAGARVVAAKKEHELAVGKLARAREAYAKGGASIDDVHAAEVREQVQAAEIRAAESAARVATADLELARAALIRTDPKSALPPEEARLEVRAPVDGKVLRVFQESAAVVTPGTKILELGDPADLEIVIEALSTDAVQVSPGDRVVVERWGGPGPLAGRVRLVEPGGFLKVSALGVEEQRVNVIADFTDPPEKWKQLGDAYRVETRTVVWESADAVKVPAGALFRSPDGGWAVFAVRDGRAARTAVTLGRSNGLEAQVLDGLAPGDRVVLHPSDRVTDGVEVVGR
jgi:HlyD family secretion protein